MKCNWVCFDGERNGTGWDGVCCTKCGERFTVWDISQRPETLTRTCPASTKSMPVVPETWGPDSTDASKSNSFAKMGMCVTNLQDRVKALEEK